MTEIYNTGDVDPQKVALLNRQVEEVVNIMSDNVHSMIQRDVKLTGLDQRTDALKDEASQFNSLASKLNRKYWWKNSKMMMILSVVAFMILVVIIVKAIPDSERTPPPFPTPTSTATPTPTPSERRR